MPDGWFATGDIGEITPQGRLKITDRKKDLIKTAGGKYVAPQKLESLLKANPLISQILILGDQKKYIVALITLEPNNLKVFAEKNSLPSEDLGGLSQHRLVLESIRKSVAETNAELASYESIKKFSILGREFTLADGEMTPSLKIKRRFVEQKYRLQIEKMYSGT